MIEAAGGLEAIAAIGITNQRETVVAWDKVTGEPLGTRWSGRTGVRPSAVPSSPQLAETTIQARPACCSIPIFSASRLEWLLANRPQLRAAGGRLAFGTIDSLAGVETDRRHGPCDRRQQCQPNHADGA
jgi:glycerol kinase